MKSTNRFLSVFVSLTMILAMLNVFSYAYAESEDTVQYAKYDFSSSSELSDFILSNNASDWSVSGGKLIYNAVDTTEHSIATDVNIPAGQNFAIELSAEYIYRYSNFTVSFNNTLALTLYSSASWQALDGKWVLYFDRTNGVKAFCNGNEITSSGTPKINYSYMTADAISNIKIAFKGSTDRNDPAFDYLYVYGYGSEFAGSVSDVTTEGLKFHTNMPISLTGSSLSVNGNTCTVAKSADGLFDYDVTFANELSANANCTLSGTLTTVFGETKTVEIDFSTPKALYADPSKYFGSDFTVASDISSFTYRGIDGTDVANAIEDGALTITSNVSGDKYPYIDKTGLTVPANKNFVIDFAMSNVYKYATTTIRFNDTDVYSIKSNNGNGSGKYRLIIDRVNGIKLYKDGALMSSSNVANTPYAQEATGATTLLNSEITSFTLKIQLNGNAQKIDYINAYAVQSTFMGEKDGDVTLQEAKIKTTEPLDLRLTTAQVGRVSATIEESDYCKYNIYFDSPIAVNAEQILAINATTLFGKTETLSFPFVIYGAPSRYINNEFASDDELADFSYSNDSFTISEGKLLGKAAANTVDQWITKAVNIPSDMGFILEFKSENLYRYSDIFIILNGANALQIQGKGSWQVLDGNWKIIFDRVRGISAYRNGTLIGSTGDQKIIGTPSLTMSDISSIKIAFKGTDNVSPAFDYIHVYSLGENEQFVSSYENAEDLSNETVSISGVEASISDGKIVLTNTLSSEKQPILTKTVDADASKDIIIDFDYNQPENYKYLEIFINGNSLVQYKPKNTTGTYRAIINRTDNTLKIYKSGALLSDYVGSVPAQKITTIGIKSFVSAGASVSFDYFNVFYGKDIEMKLGESDVYGFSVITTESLDPATIVVKDGDTVIPSTSSDGDDICLYNINFGTQLLYSKRYTLTVNAKTIRGADISGEVSFVTPSFSEATSYYSDDFSTDKNDKRFNNDGGKGTMAVSNGMLSIKSNGNGYPQYFTGYFNTDKTKALVECRMKIPYGSQHSWTAFSLEIGGTRYQITDQLYSIYEWTVFDITLDFETHIAKLYRDGVYVGEKEFATEKTAQQILSSRLSINHRFYLNGKEALIDYISVAAADSDFNIGEKETNGKKIQLKSTNPISAATLQKGAFSIAGVNVLNVKPVYGQPCVYELALDSEISGSQGVSVNIQNIEDIYGNSFNGTIKVGGAFVINNVTKESQFGKVRFFVNYTNNSNTDKTAVLIVNLKRGNGKVYKSRTINLTLSANIENGTITTEFIDNPFKFTEECFVWDGLNTMKQIY